VVAQCQKTQSQNQQNLSVKNPKHQAGIEAALSHAQKGARLEKARYNHVPTKRGHQHTEATKGVDVERHVGVER
jgi:hypothetical protein